MHASQFTFAPTRFNSGMGTGMGMGMGRFHDLVFGHELGQGSFSVVKYARHITKGKSRSEWPEFAVKVISTTKIQVISDAFIAFLRVTTKQVDIVDSFIDSGLKVKYPSVALEVE